ncbi:sensor histidine kinase [Actinosynnema sp. CS-041913]|uniref:sensor histidine kinase n=1 Tax=Actinosynnema sp. CS-041913 TaxID=3239917 RepID=UPI003D943EC8
MTDAGVAVLCVLVFWLPFDERSGCPVPVYAGLIAVLVTGLLIRSWSPATAFWLVAASTFAGVVLGVTHDPFVAAAWALYPVAAAQDSAKLSSAISVGFGAAIVALVFVGSAEFEDTVRLAMLSMLVPAGAWRLGTAVRRERQDAERAARAENERVVARERLRVVREVHDVVSHSLGTIAVTAGVAAHIGSDDAERLRHKLARIEETSKEALDELRAVLGAVRERGESVERAPQPGIADLPNLVVRAENAGVRVRLTVDSVDGVPPSAGLAVYRIVQEGLTNTTRHAPRARCEVTVLGTGHRIHVGIVDDGGAADARSSGEGGAADVRSGGAGGYGLIGLRERVELLGGEFTAGHLAEGGFAVRAVIPVSEGGDG